MQSGKACNRLAVMNAILLLIVAGVCLWFNAFDTLQRRRAVHGKAYGLVAEAKAAHGSSLAVYQLVRLAEGNYRFGAVTAACAIGELGGCVGDAVPRIAQMIDSPDPMLRREIIQSLGRLGFHGKMAIPKLVEFARGKASFEERKMALDALVEICHPPVEYAAVFRSLTGTDSILFEAAVHEVLKSQRPAAERVVNEKPVPDTDGT